MTPIFTGQRSDVALHGWVEFPNFGRAKFTDGTMVAFVPALELDNLEESTGNQSGRLLDIDAPIYMQGEALGMLNVNRWTAEAICLRCRHFIIDDKGAPNVLERFWAHQVFEHHVPPDLIGVEGLEKISTAGIRLAVQLVVRSKLQS